MARTSSGGRVTGKASGRRPPLTRGRKTAPDKRGVASANGREEPLVVFFDDIRLVRDLLGIKPPAMSEETKQALRARPAEMTVDEKRAERERRKTDRMLKRLAATSRRKGASCRPAESGAGYRC